MRSVPNSPRSAARLSSLRRPAAFPLSLTTRLCTRLAPRSSALSASSSKPADSRPATRRPSATTLPSSRSSAPLSRFSRAMATPNACERLFAGRLLLGSRDPPMSSSPPLRPLAVLVGVQLDGVSDTQHAGDLAELGGLVHTLGFDVVATVTQRRDALAAAAVLGEGKLKELAKLTGGKGVVPSGATARKSKARARWQAPEGEDDEETVDDDADAEGADDP